jgi:hypothetical protein
MSRQGSLQDTRYSCRVGGWGGWTPSSIFGFVAVSYNGEKQDSDGRRGRTMIEPSASAAHEQYVTTTKDDRDRVDVPGVGAEQEQRGVSQSVMELEKPEMSQIVCARRGWWWCSGASLTIWRLAV